MIIDFNLIPFEQEDINSLVERWKQTYTWMNKLNINGNVATKCSTFFIICSDYSYLTGFEYLKLCKEYINPKYSDLHNIKIAVYGQMYICGQITKEEFDRHISISLLQS